MIQSRRMVAAATLACLILSGCDKKAAEGNKATGEVLEGTISDSMIATDQTRVEPPLAPHTATAASEQKDKPKPGKVDSDTAQAAPVDDVSPSTESAPAPKPTQSEPAG